MVSIKIFLVITMLYKKTGQEIYESDHKRWMKFILLQILSTTSRENA